VDTPNSPKLVGDCEAPSQSDVSRAIALLSEGLLTPGEFKASTSLGVQDVPRLLTDPAVLAEVQRHLLGFRHSGSLARLEAVRHAREAVRVAIEIMRDQGMHPSSRLNAATFVAKSAGTERPIEETGDSRERHRIIINIGGKPPLIVEGPSAQEASSVQEWQ
jgi:hypothetical protein